MAGRLVLEEEKPTFAVLGLGNGGQAMAGHLSMKGFQVRAWNRSRKKVEALNQAQSICVEGAIEGSSVPELVTSDIADAVKGASVVMVVVPASAHQEIAQGLTPHLADGQIVVLNPGRTGGALAFRKSLIDSGCPACPVIAETNTFIYASRTVRPGLSHVFGVKERVAVAALPATETEQVVETLRAAFPQFMPASNVLETSLDNMGALFHPVPTLLNVTRVENGEKYEHYTKGISPAVARLLERLDLERTAIAKAFGVAYRSALDWLRESYGVASDSLYGAVHENRSYHGILAPESLDTRYLHEDVPFSLVPLVCLSELAGLDAPVMRSVVSMAEGLTGIDFWRAGRGMRQMGIDGLSIEDLLNYVEEGIS